MPSVVFVCTGNICRSPMAAAIAHQLERRFDSGAAFSSAGTHAIVGSGATPEAIAVMAELEIPLRWHRARQLSEEVVAGADLLVALHPTHVAYIESNHPSASVDLLDEVPDPYGMDRGTYRAVRDQIAEAIHERAGSWLSPP